MTVSQIWSLHKQPQERCGASLAPGLHASFREQSIISWGHRLHQANTSPWESFIWWASISFGWKVKLSHQAKLFLKLLGSLASTTHLLPWRGVLITRLPPGEDNDGAAGHAEPAGPLSSDRPADHWDRNKPLWEAEKWESEARSNPDATHCHFPVQKSKELQGSADFRSRQLFPGAQGIFLSM